jgi:hypothetical protein
MQLIAAEDARMVGDSSKRPACIDIRDTLSNGSMKRYGVPRFEALNLVFNEAAILGSRK